MIAWRESTKALRLAAIVGGSVALFAVVHFTFSTKSSEPIPTPQQPRLSFASLISPAIGAPPHPLYTTNRFERPRQRQAFPPRTDRFLIGPKTKPLPPVAVLLPKEEVMSGPEIVAALLPPSTTLQAVPPIAPPVAAPIPPEDLYDAEIRVSEQRIAMDRSRGRAAPQRASKGSLRILQIGDSHTAADFFTGEVRRLLQARFGDGGVGYVEAGRPHAGLRHSAVSIEASSGWTYTALQKSTDKNAFYLSGYNALATHAGETLSFKSEKGIAWDVMEIEVLVGPNHGSIEVKVDGMKPSVHQLKSDRNERVVLRTATNGRPTNLQTVTIKTLTDAPVTIASVALFNSQSGVSVSKVGFPGATIDILNRLDERVFTDELRRLNPHMVVLAFGTNEGFNDNLNVVSYGTTYLNVLQKIRQTLPDAKIVVIAPPAASRGSACNPPPNLERVRQKLIELAQDEKLQLWDWSSIMPQNCGAQAWASANPKLMAPDHVHLTRAGYELSAKSFARFLEPIVTEMRKIHYALSDH